MDGWKHKLNSDQSAKEIQEDDTNLLLGNRLNEILKRFDRLEQRIEALEERQFDEGEKIELVSSPNEQQKKEARTKIRRDKLANNTTIHDLKPALTERNRILRPSWILIFVAAVGCTAYCISKVVNEYRSDPTATKVRIIRQDAYDYPVMLLCPDTWLDADKAFSLNISEPGLQYALRFVINYGVHKAPYTIINYQKAKEEFENWWYGEKANRFRSLADFFKYVAIDGQSFTIDCSYCRDVDGPPPFAKILMNDGVCYNLSLPPTDGRVSLSDLDYLHIRMPVLSKGYLTQRSYWRFIVNPDLSLGMSDTHYLQVFPNHSNTIRVMPYHFKSLPNSNCITPDEVRGRNYSQSSCVANCFMTSHSCQPYPLIRSDSIPKNVTQVCNTAESAAINEETDAPEPVESQIVDTPKKCIEQCPGLCEKFVYENSVEAHKLQPRDDEDVGITSFYFRNQIVNYGGILSHEEVTTYSFDTLVSNVGGQMGLWLGASLVIIIVIKFVLNLCCEGRKTKRKQRSLAATD